LDAAGLIQTSEIAGLFPEINFRGYIT